MCVFKSKIGINLSQPKKMSIDKVIKVVLSSCVLLAYSSEAKPYISQLRARLLLERYVWVLSSFEHRQHIVCKADAFCHAAFRSFCSKPGGWCCRHMGVVIAPTATGECL